MIFFTFLYFSIYNVLVINTRHVQQKKRYIKIHYYIYVWSKVGCFHASSKGSSASYQLIVLNPRTAFVLWSLVQWYHQHTLEIKCTWQPTLLLWSFSFTTFHTPDNNNEVKKGKFLAEATAQHAKGGCQGIRDWIGTETRQIFSRMFAMKKIIELLTPT